MARSVVAEMHSGFVPLRAALPMDVRADWPDSKAADDPAVAADIARVCEIWETCRASFGDGGPFLFGGFSLADAFYAPMVSRFRTYHVPLGEVCATYAEAVWDWPDMRAWAAAAAAEPETIPQSKL